jgi:hypothetical protein
MYVKENKKRFMNCTRTHKSSCKLSYNLLSNCTIIWG